MTLLSWTSWPLWLLLAFGLLPEVVLTLADLEVLGTPRWRSLVYNSAGFYAGLLRDWTPNYGLQPVVMFASYWIFHAGFLHVAGNMAALVWLWVAFRGRLPGWVLLGVYLVSALGGALAFGMLNTGFQPMIGASGAIFGLAGLWLVLEREVLGDRWASLVTLALIALNGLIWVLEAGQLAWEGHLGGFLVGAGLGLMIPALRRAGVTNGPSEPL